MRCKNSYICTAIIVTDMRRDVQEIFRSTPHSKQVMMFSATLSKEIRPVCKKFMQDVITQSSSSLQSTIASTSLVPYLYPGQSSAHTINIIINASAG